MNRSGESAAPRRRHVLLTPHWLAGHALAAALITLFIIAGFWQLDRLGQRRAENAVRLERESAAPLLFGTAALPSGDAVAQEAVPTPSAVLDDPATGPDLALRPAIATGVFEPEGELLRRSQAYAGNPGWHVLTPLRLGDGSLLLVNRGWVPYAENTPPVAAAAPPAGTVTVTGHLEATQIPPTGFFANFAPRDPPAGPLRALSHVDLERLEREQLPGLLTGAWLQLAEQVPAQSASLPLVAPSVPPDEGPHLGYAFQWFSFAVIGLVGYWFLARRVIADDRSGAAPGVSAAPEAD